MREIILNGKDMKTREKMHDSLVEKFSLPYYYTRNLDSLYNILLKETDPVEITVENKDEIAIGYGDALMLLFKDLAANNKNYTIKIY